MNLMKPTTHASSYTVNTLPSTLTFPGFATPGEHEGVLVQLGIYNILCVSFSEANSEMTVNLDTDTLDFIKLVDAQHNSPQVSMQPVLMSYAAALPESGLIGDIAAFHSCLSVLHTQSKFITDVNPGALTAKVNGVSKTLAQIKSMAGM